MFPMIITSYSYEIFLALHEFLKYFLQQGNLNNSALQLANVNIIVREKKITFREADTSLQKEIPNSFEQYSKLSSIWNIKAGIIFW